MVFLTSSFTYDFEAKQSELLKFSPIKAVLTLYSDCCLVIPCSVNKSLVQVRDGCLFGAKPLPQQMLCYCESKPREQNQLTFNENIDKFIWDNAIETRTTRMPSFRDTPAAPWLHILMIHIRSQGKTRQKQSCKLKKIAKNANSAIFKKPYMRHTLWSCSIRCINMKWIQPEL